MRFFCLLPLFWSGLFCTAELRFFGPCFHVVGMCPCEARRFVEALRSSWILTFALFLFASAFCGLVYCSPQSCGFRTGFLVRVPTSWECVLAKQEGSLKLCALLGFSLLRFFCLLPLFFGLVCSAPQSCGFRTGFLVRVPTSWECNLAKREGSLKLSALAGFSLLRFFCLLPLFLVRFALHRRAAAFWSVFPRRGNVFLRSKKVR